MDSSVIKKHRAYPTIEQKYRLVQLVQADEEMVLAKFSETFTKQEAARRWQAIAEELNNISGAVKTWREWRKVNRFSFFDLTLHAQQTHPFSARS